MQHSRVGKYLFYNEFEYDLGCYRQILLSMMKCDLYVVIRNLVTLLLFCLIKPLSAQQCDGNLGENIFAGGDFGSGTENIPTTDPQIAPGYSYSRTGPPPDGLYVLTNNTAVWGGLYPTWLEIGDNSSDPNGYMMVVNADFSPGLFYEELVENLCENTLYEFRADIINLIMPTVPNHILPQVDFLLNDEVLFSTGPIGQDGRWNTYGFTFRTDPGVTEMTLTLRNNAPGGIGNDLALDNISFRACGPSSFIGIESEETIFLCQNDNQPVDVVADLGNSGFQVQWQLSADEGQTWNDLQGETGERVTHNNFAPGTYRYRYLAAPTAVNLGNFKCRTISDELEIEVLPITFDVIDTICTGLPYALGNGFVTTPGTHMASLVSSKNCDSIVTLKLTFQPDPDIFPAFNLINPACAGDASGQIEITGATGSIGPFSYQINGREANNGLQDELIADTYQIVTTDRYRCQDSILVELEDPEPFIVDVGQDTTILLGTVLPLNLMGSYPTSEIRWTPESYLSCADCDNPSLTGIEDLTYLVEARNERGCLASDTLRVRVDRDLRVYAPNAFTPNDDGVNDHFDLQIPGQAVREIEVLHIFDRWGNQVFELRNASPGDQLTGWDGMVYGQPAAVGVYLFSATLVLLDDTREVRSGSITLIR